MERTRFSDLWSWLHSADRKPLDFMGIKKLNLAVRVNSDYPTLVKVEIKDTLGNPLNYQLLSIPFYLLGQIYRLIDDSLGS